LILLLSFIELSQFYENVSQTAPCATQFIRSRVFRRKCGIVLSRCKLLFGLGLILFQLK